MTDLRVKPGQHGCLRGGLRFGRRGNGNCGNWSDHGSNRGDSSNRLGCQSGSNWRGLRHRDSNGNWRGLRHWSRDWNRLRDRCGRGLCHWNGGNLCDGHRRSLRYRDGNGSRLCNGRGGRHGLCDRSWRDFRYRSGNRNRLCNGSRRGLCHGGDNRSRLRSWGWGSRFGRRLNRWRGGLFGGAFFQNRFPS